jgi:hypothetical protein
MACSSVISVSARNSAEDVIAKRVANLMAQKAMKVSRLALLSAISSLNGISDVLIDDPKEIWD